MKYFDKDGLNLFFVDNATEPINVFLVKSRQNRYCLTAIMTDTINSEKSATAWYGDIWFTKKNESSISITEFQENILDAIQTLKN